MSAGRGNLLSQAIRLVLHHPAAARAVAGAGASRQASIYPGYRVLKELLEQAAEMAQPSTAMLLERWRERPEYERLTELAHRRPAMVAEAAAAAKELKMAVEKLLQESRSGAPNGRIIAKSGGIWA